MYRIALVDDDRGDRGQVKDLVLRFARERELQVRLEEFDDGEDLVGDYQADYALILLDIEMAFLDGMKTAERIRQLDEEVPIVFITNMPQYAIQGYKVRALDYLLKPLNYFALCETLNRVFAKREEKKAYLIISQKGGKMRLDISKICYVEVCDHLLIYHTLEGEYPAKGSIQEVEGQLEDPAFFRCNRCYIVNLAFVESMHGNDIQVNGEIVQVSRSRKKSFLDALNEYMNGGRV